MAPSLKDTLCKTIDRLARGLADDRKHLGERPAGRFGLAPSGQRLRHRVHERNPPLPVRGDDAVADAPERSSEPFPSVPLIASHPSSLESKCLGALHKIRLQVPPLNLPPELEPSETNIPSPRRCQQSRFSVMWRASKINTT